VTILDLDGKMTLLNHPGRVKDTVTRLIFRGRKNIVLNLENVTYVDSCGLGELVSCYTTASGHSATVKLANAERRIQDLLVLTRLLTIFDCYESEADAIASFAVAA